jgi:hypothetical protein
MRYLSPILYSTVLVVLVFGTEAGARDGLECGREYRFETRDGTFVQGVLESHAGDSLVLHGGLFGTATLAADDIFLAYRVNRKTVEGVVVGALFGTLVGGLAAMATDNRGGNMFDDIGGRLQDGAGVVLGGALIGSFVGGLLGHRIQKLGPVDLDGPILCYQTEGGTVRCGLRFALSF